MLHWRLLTKLVRQFFKLNLKKLSALVNSLPDTVLQYAITASTDHSYDLKEIFNGQNIFQMNDTKYYTDAHKFYNIDFLFFLILIEICFFIFSFNVIKIISLFTGFEELMLIYLCAGVK